MKQWHMIIDVSKCEDCNNCLLACKDEHLGNEWPGYTASQPRHGHRWISVERKERGQFPLVQVAYLPTPCQQCADAPCVAKSNGAIQQRQDGIVVIDPENAKGNTQLVNSCPYGAIFWNEEVQVAQKCTMCAHLLDNGWKQTRCVQACPTGALQLKFMDEHETRRLMQSEQLSILHPEFKTAPRVLYKNLRLFDRCFIAGSVAFEKHDLVDCAANVRVELALSDGSIRATETNAFGDFCFDGLEASGSSYEIVLDIPGYAPRRIPVSALRASVNIGTLCLEPLFAAASGEGT